MYMHMDVTEFLWIFITCNEMQTKFCIHKFLLLQSFFSVKFQWILFQKVSDVSKISIKISMKFSKTTNKF